MPVIQMSLDYQMTPQAHYDLAKELSNMRKQDILIAGSGNIVHNLGMAAWDRMNDPGILSSFILYPGIEGRK